IARPEAIRLIEDQRHQEAAEHVEREHSVPRQRPGAVRPRDVRLDDEYRERETIEIEQGTPPAGPDFHASCIGKRPVRSSQAAFLCRVAALRRLPLGFALRPLAPSTLWRNASIRLMTLLGSGRSSGTSIVFPLALRRTSVFRASSYSSLNFDGSKCPALVSRMCSASLTVSRGSRCALMPEKYDLASRSSYG